MVLISGWLQSVVIDLTECEGALARECRGARLRDRVSANVSRGDRVAFVGLLLVNSVN
jgi:hypothetical protein